MSEFKKWLVVIGAAVLCVALIWFGWRLITVPAVTSVGVLFVMGCAAVLGGVFVLGNPEGKARQLGVILLLVGCYYFARAAGWFEHAWLTRALGVASLVAAAVVGYVALKTVQAKPAVHDDTPAN